MIIVDVVLWQVRCNVTHHSSQRAQETMRNFKSKLLKHMNET
jgi:hypothetical protein